MKIAAKILVSHFVLALLVLVIGALGYFSLGQVSAQYERALRQTMPVIDAIQDARYFAERIVALAYLRQPGADGAAREAVAQGDQELTAAFDALRKEIRRHRLLVESHFPGERAVAETLDRGAIRRPDAAVLRVAPSFGSCRPKPARGG